MANDYISIRCKKCRTELTMFKYSPDGFGWALISNRAWGPDGEELYDSPEAEQRLDDFMKAHLAKCHGFYAELTLEGDPKFELVTESEPPEGKQ
jgi:hypothetical protein